jgi:hypothetical protein
MSRKFVNKITRYSIGLVINVGADDHGSPKQILIKNGTPNRRPLQNNDINYNTNYRSSYMAHK